MAPGLRACKHCRHLFEGASCPNCGSGEFKESFKGKISVLDPEQSEIAKNLKIGKRGIYAVKLG